MTPYRVLFLCNANALVLRALGQPSQHATAQH